MTGEMPLINRLYGLIGPKSMPEEVWMKHPFLDYASTYWHYHVSKLDRADKDLFLLLDSFLKPNSKALLSWLDLTGQNHAGRTSPLYVAASKGLAHYTEHLLRLGYEVDGIDRQFRTPLHRAVADGYSPVVAILLQWEAAIDPDDFAGFKPLHLAAMKNHYNVVRLLLEAGVDLFTPKTKEYPGPRCGNGPRTTGCTAVQDACEYGHTETVQHFLSYLDPDGISKILFWATGSGRTDVVLAILETPKVQINKSIEGKTPIFLAAYKHDLKSMRELLEMGADITITCNTVFSTDGFELVSYMDAIESSPLHAFALNCRTTSSGETDNRTLIEVFNLLFQAGCDVNAVDALGRTALHLPCHKQRSAELVRMLVEAGADPKQCDFAGNTILHLAARQLQDSCHGKQESEMLEAIVKMGICASIRNNEGQTPFHIAAGMRLNPHSPDYMTITYDFWIGAACNLDVNAADHKGIRPIHLAATLSEHQVARLLDDGADPLALTVEGQSVL